MMGVTNASGLGPLLARVESRPGIRLGTTAHAQKATPTQNSFSQYLEAQLKDVNEVQIEANEAVSAMATGRSHNIHETMIALDKADVSFRMLTKVRNKAVEAYQEIMRMQI